MKVQRLTVVPKLCSLLVQNISFANVDKPDWLKDPKTGHVVSGEDMKRLLLPNEMYNKYCTKKFKDKQVGLDRSAACKHVWCCRVLPIATTRCSAYSLLSLPCHSFFFFSHYLLFSSNRLGCR